jgi:hypothetical protein
MPTDDVLNSLQTFITYTNVFGGTVTEDDLVGLLKTLSKQKTLVILSQIGFILHNETAFDAKVQWFIAKQCFNGEDLKKISDAMKRLQQEGTPINVFFSELQVLNMMKLIMLHVQTALKLTTPRRKSLPSDIAVL